MSKTEMRMFKKKDRTGMHQTTFKNPLTTVNGEKKQGRTVLRPGNTIYCDPAELGNPHHMAQFEALDGKPVAETADDNVVDPGQASLVLRKRDTSNFYDIINPLNPDKTLNKKALRKGPAEKLLASMLTEGQELKVDDSAACLLGSSDLPSMVDINGEEVPLGDIVCGAHQKSGLSLTEWNELAGRKRDKLLSDHIASLQDEDNDTVTSAGANDDDNDTDEDNENDGLDALEWDDLVIKMEEADLEVLDEHEDDDDLRKALREDAATETE